MSRICYGLFESTEQAQPAVTELTRGSEDHPVFAVGVHEKQLNPQDLPDCGTELARNNVISAVAGGGIGLVGGSIAGGAFDIIGLDLATGAGIGLITGVLIGILSGMMSGARSAKKPLRDLAAELERGLIIVTVGVDDHGLLDLVESTLSEAGGRRVGNA